MSWPRNALPSILAFAPVILLPLAQDMLRARLPSSGPAGLILGSAPNFIIGFCFPFSILLRPRLFRERTARRAFHLWCALTLTVLVVLEFRDSLGPNMVDPADLVASVLGVGLALAVFHLWLGRRLVHAPSAEPSARSA